jgi:hypothetical protein
VFRAAAGLAVAVLVHASAEAQGFRANPAPLLDVSWGSTPDTVRSRAERAGWSFLTIDDDGDHAYRGSINGESAVVFATYGSAGLVRLLVSIDPHPSAPATYSRLADTLRTRFGSAVLSTDPSSDYRPSPSMVDASAWYGLVMGLRRDGRILLVFTCPSASPQLPVRGARLDRVAE